MLLLVGWNSKHVTRLLWYLITAQFTSSGITNSGFIYCQEFSEHEHNEKGELRLLVLIKWNDYKMKRSQQAYRRNSMANLAFEYIIQRVVCAFAISWNNPKLHSYSVRTINRCVTFKMQGNQNHQLIFAQFRDTSYLLQLTDV